MPSQSRRPTRALPALLWLVPLLFLTGAVPGTGSAPAVAAASTTTPPPPSTPCTVSMDLLAIPSGGGIAGYVVSLHVKNPLRVNTRRWRATLRYPSSVTVLRVWNMALITQSGLGTYSYESSGSSAVVAPGGFGNAGLFVVPGPGDSERPTVINCGVYSS